MPLILKPPNGAQRAARRSSAARAERFLTVKLFAILPEIAVNIGENEIIVGRARLRPSRFREPA
jgi:hypothetical protein